MRELKQPYLCMFLNKMHKIDIRNLTYKDLLEYFKLINASSFRANQVFDWIYKKNIGQFKEMKNLPIRLINQLERDYILHKNVIVRQDISSDGTVKVLFSLYDEETIETVIIPADARTTVCISTQAGCKYGCKFCASGIGGFKRNLEVSEIIDQIMQSQKILETHNLAKTQKKVSSSGLVVCPRITNVVFMGVGEPLENYDNLMKAIRIINNQKWINIAL